MASTVFFINDPENKLNWLQLSLRNGDIWLEEKGGEGMEMGEGELYKLLRDYYDGNF